MEHSSIILSILICGLDGRESSRSYLIRKLQNQISVNNYPVEILIDVDNKEKTTGQKRNDLLSRAQGEYICFIDDDDDISDDYIKEIMNALEDKPDCIGMQGLLCCSKGKFIFEHSIQYQGWYTSGTIENPHFYRTPNHLNPVRKSIAIRVGFPLVVFGEDGIYSKGIRQFLKTEVFIDHPIYYYFTEI